MFKKTTTTTKRPEFQPNCLHRVIITKISMFLTVYGYISIAPVIKSLHCKMGKIHIFLIINKIK